MTAGCIGFDILMINYIRLQVFTLQAQSRDGCPAPLLEVDGTL